VVLYNKIFAVTFDENFSRACGTKVDLYNTLIAVLTAVTIVLGMRMMGTLIISALIIFPAVTAMRLFKSFKSVAITSAILSVTSFIIAFFASFIYDLPTGATIVAVDTILLILFIIIEKFKRVVK
jgi:zinc transport system permease protein